MWPFVTVANACVEILLIIGLGYVLAWRGFVVSEKFLPQINSFLIFVSFPALNLSSIGINLDLRDASGWRALAAYILWVTIIQVGVLMYVHVFHKGDVGEAALLNLLLAANNTIIIGLPIMTATFGTDGRYIALLTGVALFLQIMPFSIVLFELERWVVKGVQPGAGTSTLDVHTSHQAAAAPLPDTTATADGAASPTKPPPPASAMPGDTSPTMPATPALLTGAPLTDVHSTQHQQSMRPGAAAAAAPLQPSPFSGAGTAAAAAGPMLSHLHSSSEGNLLNRVPTAAVSQALLLSHRLSHMGAGAGPDAAQAHAGASGSSAQLLQHQQCDAGVAAGGIPHTSSAQQLDSPCHPCPHHQPHRHQGPHPHSAHPLQHAQHRSRSIQEQLHFFFQEAAELRRHRKEAKRRQRALVSVVDVPLPLAIANAQICNAPLPTAAMMDDPHHAPGLPLPHLNHLNHHADAYEPSGVEQQSKALPAAAGSPSDALAAPHALLDWPWEAWHRLLDASKQSLHRIANSFSVATGSGRFNFDQHLGPQHVQHGGEHLWTLPCKYGAVSGSGGAPGGLQLVDAPTQSLPLPSIAEPMPTVGISITGQAPGSTANSTPAPTLAALPPAGKPLQAGLPSEDPQAAASNSALHMPTAAAAGHHSGKSGSARGGSGGDVGEGSTALRSDRSFARKFKVQRAMHKAVRHHGSMWHVAVAWFHAHTQVWTMIVNIFKNPMLWSLLLAMVVSLSGLRVFLDPSSGHYVAGMGWLTDTLALLKGTTVPLALFANGTFLWNKRFWEGNVKKACVILVIKILVLPFLQLACTKALGLSTSLAMSLILLSICPCATTGFVLASSYGHGAEIITMVTVVMTVLLVPLVLAALNIPQALGIYHFDSASFPLP